MTKPSKGAALFLTLFGLPFLGAGVAFIFAQLAARGNHTPLEATASTMFGSGFAFIGGALMYAAIGGYARLKASCP